MNIVLVEDNPADMRLVREALSEGDVPAVLHWSPSGEEALSYLRRQACVADASTTDLVLLDLNLPGLNGQEVLQAIKQDPVLLHIPVVVLTSSSARTDVLAAYRSHANAYVVKPDDFDEFVALVGEINRHWFQAVLLPGHPA